MMPMRHSFRIFGSVALALAAVAACGGSKDEAASSSSSAGGPAPGVDPQAPAPVSVKFPDIKVPGGKEETECVTLRLPNDAPLKIGSIHNTLGDGSHHLIVYKVIDTEEKTTPYKCQPFADTLDATKGSPLMVTQKHDDLLQLPPGVGFSIAAHQMIRLEMHYINPTSEERTITATSKMNPIAEQNFKDEADFLFIGNPDISIPAKSKATLGPTFFELPEDFVGTKFFAMTGHEHQYGTNVQIALSSAKGDPGKMVYDVPNWSWSEPKTEVFNPPLEVPAKGGFTFTCSWNNTSDQKVTFGESANDEMCFFWAYYYPSKGAKVCFHSNRAGGPEGLDICCPEHPLCNLINDQLSK